MTAIVPTIGIDVSKDRLDVAVHPSGEQFSIDNDVAGWRVLVRRLKPIGARAIGIEASGGYERGAIGALLKAELPIRSVNAWKLRQFARAAGLLAKTDRLDARAIAWFVASLPPDKERGGPAGRRATMFAAAKLGTLGLYLLAILVVGRFREWRLLLPALPLLLVFLLGPARQTIETKKSEPY